MTTLYGLASCDACRKARKWLERSGIAHTFIDYREQPRSPEMLGRWSQQAGGFDAIINKASTTWRTLPANRKAPGSTAEWQLLLREYPQLIRRPVIVTADGVMTQGFSDKGFKQRFGIGT